MTTVLFGSRGSDRDLRQPVGCILYSISADHVSHVGAGTCREDLDLRSASDDSGHFA
jgi:hypothetical protein